MITIRSKCYLIALLLFCNLSVCSAYNKDEKLAYPIHFLNKKLTEILINDGFSPPVASRAYAYPNLCAYTVLTESSGEKNLLNNVLIDFPHLQNAEKLPNDFSPSVASAYAFYYVSKKLIYTIGPFEDSFKTLLSWYRSEGYTDLEITNSQKVAKDYFDSFISWVNKDNFAEVKVMPEYSLDDSPGHWVPTYPSYMQALEPHWGLMRYLTRNSGEIDLSKFSALKYDISPGSSLYNEAMGVYKVTTSSTTEERKKADFWDCNAYAVYPNGHEMTIVKKISPGGHWIYITCIAAQNSHADLEKSEFAYALTATAIYDGFIWAWKLKYKYKTLRPETYLQDLKEPDFRPYLQSPPFPEYLSAHAVISMAAATVLTHFYGPSFHFTDNTEEYLRLPDRSFSSFKEAAAEAAISRFYGGIHYKYSCIDGSSLGALIGDKILEEIKK